MSTAYDPDALERWERHQRFVPYGGIPVGTVLTLLIRDVDWPGRPVAVAARWPYRQRTTARWYSRRFRLGWIGCSSSTVTRGR